MATQRPKAEDVGDSGLRLGGGALAGLSGVGILAVFMAQNLDDVTVHFLVWDFACPVWLLILGAAVLGGLVWFGIGLVRTRRRRKDRREDRRSRRRE